jgi:mannose-6-phosphate isomerase-like protein (cupin superfamily)
MNSPDPITRLSPALQGRYRSEREPGRRGMALVYLVGLIALNACGGRAPALRASGSPSPSAAPVELPLGAGRPEVEGITRTVLTDDASRTVTRVRFAPGAGEVPHTHTFELLVVPLTTGSVDWVLGDRRFSTLAAGDVQLVPAGVTHQLRNPGSEPYEVVAIAVKHIERR